MIKRQFNIVCTGKTEADVQHAFDAAILEIMRGNNTVAKDVNEKKSACYFYEVNKNFDITEYPVMDFEEVPA